MDADTICRDDQCMLGKWLHGRGKSSYGSRPQFASLIEAHRVFHEEAGKVARVVNQGAGQEAERMLESDTGFGRASQQVTQLIVQLKSEIEGRGVARAIASARAAKPAEKRSSATAAGADGDWESF